MAHILFNKIVQQARQPVFYQDWQVPDTLDGRFDLIILHVSLVVDRLESQSQNRQVARLIRFLQEVLFDNMDMSLRELGVGDMSVGKKVKVMAEAYYGRKKAYQETIRSEDMAAGFKAALTRNIYRDQQPDEKICDLFVAYIMDQIVHLEHLADENLISGQLTFSEVK